jgi:hypothetical protein
MVFDVGLPTFFVTHLAVAIYRRNFPMVNLLWSGAWSGPEDRGGNAEESPNSYGQQAG